MEKPNIKQDIDQVFDRTHKRHKYENFNEDQKAILNKWFIKSPYPKIEDYELISQEIDKPVNKIQNWFKYHRRLSALESEEKLPQYKSKNVLSPQAFAKLKEFFKQNQNPTIKEFRDLSKNLNLKETQINSWFTYRRRKLRLNKNLKKKFKKIKKCEVNLKIKKISKETKLHLNDPPLTTDLHQKDNIILPSLTKKEYEAPILNNPNTFSMKQEITQIDQQRLSIQNDIMVQKMNAYRNIMPFFYMSPQKHCQNMGYYPQNYCNTWTNMSRINNLNQMPYNQGYPKDPMHFNLPINYGYYGNKIAMKNNFMK